MKKLLIILFCFPLIFSSCEEEEEENIVFTQSLQVSSNGFFYGNPGIPVASHIIVKNLTTSSLEVMCKKIIIDTTAGTSNYFCWGASCWPSSVYVSPIPAGVRTIPAAYSDSTNFTGYYDAFGNPARAVVKYCFYPHGNVADSSCVTIHYNDN
jgi:hypothetical protein|tara:strand:- start:108 stop:566 length:459 start_codon:yes stop_codon:yes gene_type:complete